MGEIRLWGSGGGCGEVGYGRLQLGEGEGELGCEAVQGAERMKGEAVGQSWCTGALVRGRSGLWGGGSGVWTWMRNWGCGLEENGALRQWVWGVGRWGCCPIFFDCSIAGYVYRRGRWDCWPCC